MHPPLSFCIRFRDGLELHLSFQPSLQLADGHSDLLHGIAVTDGDGVVGLFGLGADGLEVHGDAVGSADLVLTAVTLADGTGIVQVLYGGL